jgi:hypothetical protein
MRYLKVIWPINVRIHVISATFIFTTTMILGIMAVWKSDWEIATDNAHTIIGFIVLVVVGVIYLFGLVIRMRLKR